MKIGARSTQRTKVTTAPIGTITNISMNCAITFRSGQISCSRLSGAGSRESLMLSCSSTASAVAACAISFLTVKNSHVIRRQNHKEDGVSNAVSLQLDRHVGVRGGDDCDQQVHHHLKRPAHRYECSKLISLKDHEMTQHIGFAGLSR